MKSELFARRIRAQALRMVHRARASHIGSALSIADIVAVSLTREQFLKRYGEVFKGDSRWQAMGKAKPSLTLAHASQRHARRSAAQHT